MIPPTILVEAPTLASAWEKLVKETMKNGVILPTEYGPKSKDICSLTTVRLPYAEPFLHPSFPTKKNHLTEYIKQFGRDYDWRKQGFTYTYMDRFTNYQDALIPNHDQIKDILENLKKPISRRSQMITWIPSIDAISDEPPCLQRIWMRRLNETDIEMHCDWRSRDLYGAWNSNYVAILAMIAREILQPLNLRIVKLVDFCDSLHIYEADWEAASNIIHAPVNPMLMRYS